MVINSLIPKHNEKVLSLFQICFYQDKTTLSAFLADF